MHATRPGPETLAASVTVASFVLYLATLHPSLPAGDSGELIAVAHQLGIAHPPGYPLFTLIGHVWIRLWSFADPAWAMNLLSAVTQAIACGVLTWATARWTKNPTAAIAAGAAWAVTAPVWKMALVTEVFALNALLAALLFAAFVRVLQGGAKAAYAVVCLLCGALFAHHHTLVLLAAPVYVVSVVSLRAALRTRDLVLRAVGFGLLGASPILTLPLIARTQPTVAWGDPTSVSGLIHHLLRGDYGTLSLEPEQSGLTTTVSHVALWLESIPFEAGIPATVLAVVGIAALIQGSGTDTRTRALALALGGFAILQALFFTRVGFPDEPLFVGVVERFWILPAMVVSFLAALGLHAVARRVPGPVTWILAVMVVTWPAAHHLRTVDQSNNTFVDDMIADVLASVPEGGALFVQGDLLHNALAVATVVRGARNDVAWADQELMTYSWAVDRIRARHADLLPDPLGRNDAYDADDSTSYNVHWFDHLDDRPTTLIGVKEDSYARRYAMVPRGLVSLVVPRHAVPALDAQAETAIALMDSVRWRGWFRPQDPRSFEAHERWRLADFVARTSLLACQPSAMEWTTATHPGLIRLADFLDTLVAHDHDGDHDLIELDRAGGLVSALHPAIHDVERARALLARALRSESEGPRADEARRVLDSLRSVDGSR